MKNQIPLLVSIHGFFYFKSGHHFVQASSQLVFAGLRSSFPLTQPHSAVFSLYFGFTWRAELSLLSPCIFHNWFSLCISSSPAPSLSFQAAPFQPFPPSLPGQPFSPSLHLKIGSFFPERSRDGQ